MKLLLCLTTNTMPAPRPVRDMGDLMLPSLILRRFNRPTKACFHWRLFKFNMHCMLLICLLQVINQKSSLINNDISGCDAWLIVFRGRMLLLVFLVLNFNPQDRLKLYTTSYSLLLVERLLDLPFNSGWLWKAACTSMAFISLNAASGTT